MDNFKKIIDKYISEATNIGVISHMNPDDDAITSALATKWYIQNYFPTKTSEVMFSASKTDRWDYLYGANEIQWVDDISDHIAKYDLLIFLDGTNILRFTKKPEALWATNIKTLCIDHHIHEDNKFTEVVRNENACACVQIIAEALISTKDLANKDLSQILLVGIYDDSGNLTYVSKESFGVFETVKNILEKSGLNIQKILTEKSRFDQNTFLLFKELVENTQSVKLGDNFPPLTYSYYNEKTYEKYAEGTLSYIKKYYAQVVLRMIKGHDWGFVLTPLKDHFSISFRSSPGGPNVQKICKEHFQGGGHTFTASGKIDRENITSIEYLVNKTLDDLECMEIEITSL